MSTTTPPSEKRPQEFPPSMGKPANAALLREGITTLNQVAKLTEKELLSLHGVGPKAVRILKELLAKQGKALKKN